MGFLGWRISFDPSFVFWSVIAALTCVQLWALDTCNGVSCSTQADCAAYASAGFAGCDSFVGECCDCCEDAGTGDCGVVYTNCTSVPLPSGTECRNVVTQACGRGVPETPASDRRLWMIAAIGVLLTGIGYWQLRLRGRARPKM